MQAEKFAAQFPAIVYSICHIPEKKLLLVGTSAGSIHVLDLEKKQEIKILQHHTEPIFDLRYSPTTNCFYSVGGDGNFAICSLETLSLIKIKIYRSCSYIMILSLVIYFILFLNIFRAAITSMNFHVI